MTAAAAWLPVARQEIKLPFGKIADGRIVSASINDITDAASRGITRGGNHDGT